MNVCAGAIAKALNAPGIATARGRLDAGASDRGAAAQRSSKPVGLPAKIGICSLLAVGAVWRAYP